MQSVYIETTIPSYYFETRQKMPIPAWRAATQQWWKKSRPQYELVTSKFVIAELEEAPEPKATLGRRLLEHVHMLEVHPRTEEIVGQYIKSLLMPRDALGDAAHLATCSLFEIDFLLTWNCRHLANANKFAHLRELNRRLGLFVPTLVTPLGLMPEDFHGSP